LYAVQSFIYRENNIASFSRCKMIKDTKIDHSLTIALGLTVRDTLVTKEMSLEATCERLK